MDKKIIQGCLKQDNFYQKLMVERLAPLLMSTCKRYNSDVNSCQDILQETFIKLFKNIHNFKGNEHNFLAWAHRICVNECIDHIHRSKRYNFEPLETNTEDHGQSLEYDAYDTVYLLKMIECLPQQYRAIFNLIAVDGYTHHEVSKILEISEPTSRSNYSRARKKLQLMIQQKETVKNG